MVQAELRRRHVAQQASGLILLPIRDPKPVPPPEFWTQESPTMSAPLVSAKAAALATLKQFAQDRRFGRKPKG